MARSRMMNGDEPAEMPSPRTTIVGGRPPEKDAKLPPVPTGIQRLLRLASIDEAFRRELLARRGDIAEAAQVPLSASEAAILKAIPAAHLEEMATKMPPPPQGRRDFLRQTAATAVVLLGGAALSEAVSGCDRPPAEPPAPRPADSEVQVNAGVAPDMPPAPNDADAGIDTPSRPAETGVPVPAGVRPDIPPQPDAGSDTPERPVERPMETEGGAAPDEPPERLDKPIKTRGVTHDLPPERPEERPMDTKGGAKPDMPDEK